jgi:hypothetical protein
MTPERAGNERSEHGRRLAQLRYMAVLGPLFERITKTAMRRSPDMAVEFYRREITWRTRRYGPDAAQTLISRSHYAVALDRNGESAAAEAELADLIARYDAVGRATDEAAWSARTWHARVLIDLGRYDDAERDWRSLADDGDRALGPADPASLGAHQNHAGVLYELGRLQEGEAELAGVIAAWTAKSGAEGEVTLGARTTRAVMLDALGRIAESESEWRELSDAYDRLKGDGNPDGLTAHEKHAVALYKLGRLQEAAAEFAQVATRRQIVLGASHDDTQRAVAWRDTALRELDDRK